MRLTAAASIILMLAGCSRTTPDYRWIGTMASSTPAACPPLKASASLRDGFVTFTPGEGTWVLRGLASPDGRLEADKDLDSAKTSFETHLEGRWSRAELAGTYTTLKCRYAVDLKRY